MPSDAWRRRVAFMCLAAMSVVVVASAFLRHHGASEALQMAWQPELMRARQLHRVAATLVLVGALVLTGLGRAGPRGRHALLLLALLLSAVGWAGGATRSAPVVIVNLLGGFAMLAICARLAGTASAARLGGVALGALALLALQAALGAAVRAQGVHELAQGLAAAHRLAGMLVVIVLAVVGFQAMHALQRRSGAALTLLAVGLLALGALSSAGDATPALLVAHNALAAAAAAALARLY
jgi:hypothetical protein